MGANLSENEDDYDEEDTDNKAKVFIINKKQKEKDTRRGLFKNIFFWLCGIENMKRSDDDDENRVQEVFIDTSIDENSYWAAFCNVNAVVAVGLSCFCFAFFNKYA